LTEKLHLEAYLHRWHLIKLRKMELRRILFSDRSIFGVESAALQFRKIIEGICQSWVLLAERGGMNVSDGLRMSNDPEAIFNQLKKRNFKFPIRSTLENKGPVGTGNTHWHIDHVGTGREAAEILVGKYRSLHGLLHSQTPYIEFPIPSDLSSFLRAAYAKLADHHQEIWNLYWVHSAFFAEN
jgi:hypothetical protein